MDVEEIKNKIDSIGNVKVIFEPRIYDENRILKRELREILERSQVSLRGWNFPHIPLEDGEDEKKPYSIGNGIEFYTSWDSVAEIFRFYQSGQFLGKFVLYEDTVGTAYGKEIGQGKYLDFLSIIYKVTEIILFIRNLIDNMNIEGGNLTIEIYKTKNRELSSIFSQNLIPFSSRYVCRIDRVTVTRNLEKEKLSTEFLEIGRQFIMEIFDDFNWRNYSEQMIETHQEKLLSRRI